MILYPYVPKVKSKEELEKEQAEKKLAEELRRELEESTKQYKKERAAIKARVAPILGLDDRELNILFGGD